MYISHFDASCKHSYFMCANKKGSFLFCSILKLRKHPLKVINSLVATNKLPRQNQYAQNSHSSALSYIMQSDRGLFVSCSIDMKINHIFFVIKGQFPVTDYSPNTIILYFIVHCIYVLCLFYCITCLCLSLTPPVSGLRCIVFNKVMFCSVLF